MVLTPYDMLPVVMQNPAVHCYYEKLTIKKSALLAKRVVDLLICGIATILASPFLLIFALLIKLTSKGEVFYRQERIGKDMKPFYMFKFRTMVKDADKKGALLTTGDDSRITTFGRFLRRINMDEMPQLFNVLKGDMSIIGTRPEVKKYVDLYTDDMLATLLLPPGMLSLASIRYKDENSLLTGATDPHKVYIEQILPDKMQYNLGYLERISLGEDMRLIGQSIACMFKRS